jgi:hypothetical protein
MSHRIVPGGDPSRAIGPKPLAEAAEIAPLSTDMQRDIMVMQSAGFHAGHRRLLAASP